nr:hypothetical protein [Tanacetum cinerariifolium]
MIEKKISMISAEKITLEDLFKRANAEFPNDGKVIKLYEKYRRLFKESVLVEDFQAHIDDFDNNDDDGGGKNDDHGSDNVGKKKESTGNDVVNDKKDGMNAEKDGVNAVQEGEADMNEELEDMLEEETFTQWIEKNIDWVGESPSAMIILDNSNCEETYNSKYKAVCEPLAFKFESENDEQTRISIIVNAIKNMDERNPAKTKTFVENQG